MPTLGAIRQVPDSGYCFQHCLFQNFGGPEASFTNCIVGWNILILRQRAISWFIPPFFDCLLSTRPTPSHLGGSVPQFWAFWVWKVAISTSVGYARSGAPSLYWQGVTCSSGQQSQAGYSVRVGGSWRVDIAQTMATFLAKKSVNINFWHPSSHF